MGLKELLNMEIGTSKYSLGTGYAVSRVPGGWIYAAWDYSNEVILDSGVFVPEPKGIKLVNRKLAGKGFQALFTDDLWYNGGDDD